MARSPYARVQTRSPAPSRRPRLGLETLEDRWVPTAYQVSALPADFPGLAAGLTPDGRHVLSTGDGDGRTALRVWRLPDELVDPKRE